MAYICEKNIRCSQCKHYRFDEDYGAWACFAKENEWSRSDNPKKREDEEKHEV